MKVLISKKIHLLRPAIEYVQQISRTKKVRRWLCARSFVCTHMHVAIEKIPRRLIIPKMRNKDLDTNKCVLVLF